MLKQLTLQRQLYGLCAVFFAPILVLATLHAQQAIDNIAFSRSERDGVAYLTQLNPVLHDAARGKSGHNLRALSKASIAFDSQMKTWEQSTQFQISLAAQSSLLKTVQAGTAFVTAIGDGSNLILDPDLDSYYLMDIVVTRMPALLEQFARLDNSLQDRATHDPVARQNALNLLSVQLASTRQNLTNSMAAAVRNNENGLIAKATLVRYGKLLATLEARSRDLDALKAEPIESAETRAMRIALITSSRAAMVELRDATSTYLEVLDALIANRISAKYQFLAISLLLAMVAASLAVFVALGIARRISANVSSLTGRIVGMTEGDFSSPIPLQDQKDELGQIARSLTQFRAHAVENAALAESLEAERAASRDQLEKLAYYDDLTGLPNRKYLSKRIEQHVRDGDRSMASALVYLDLDGFKEVNDTMTHLAGDELLQEVARRLVNFVGESDLVVRLGGDEFAVFFSQAQDQRVLEHLCQSILQSLAEPYRVHSSMQYLSASAGIALLHLSSARDAVELIRRADVAMYRAKDLGKNRAILFDSGFDADALYRKTIESALRDALPRGEIQLLFQPQLDVRTSKLVGVEGLARWNSQRHGEISPTVFIPIAESAGLIYDLGLQVLRQAIAAAHRWPQLRISVNVSVAQLRSPRLIDDVSAVMTELNGPKGRIELEITESVVMEDDDMLNDKLMALRDIGFELALDDFGTGYSSLGYLTRYNFDRLKIDRSFIRAAVGSPRGAALLEGIARMGRALGMDVCAEGVETFEDVESTTQAGCTLLQGFYFSPAVGLADIDHMIASGVARPVEPTVHSQLVELEQRLAS